MKLPLLILTIPLAFSTQLQAPAGASTAAAAPGRYQLVAATVMCNEQSTPALFRIDTASGETWIYRHAKFPLPSLSTPNNTALFSAEGWDHLDSYSSSLDWYRQYSQTNNPASKGLE